MTIKAQIASHAQQIGHMVGLNRELTLEERETLYETFIMAPNPRSADRLAFGDFLAWCIDHTSKVDGHTTFQINF